MQGFEETTPAPSLMRTVGKRLVMVHTVGAGLAGAWGYTIWEGARCIAGRCDWQHWTRDDACRAAIAALAELPAAP